MSHHKDEFDTSEFNLETAESHHKKVHQDAAELKKHESHLAHQVIAGAAAFEAYRLYEKKRNPDEPHSNGKAALAAIAAASVDKLVETKGMDFVDKQKAKRYANKAADKLYDDNANK
ncbi:hypothetical protein G9A89_014003 [Geosiphon pyriformis]|nr:hypothetical protein G9A89_014003 [Geosiphon pyriformis]